MAQMSKQELRSWKDSRSDAIETAIGEKSVAVAKLSPAAKELVDRYEYGFNHILLDSYTKMHLVSGALRADTAGMAKSAWETIDGAVSEYSNELDRALASKDIAKLDTRLYPILKHAAQAFFDVSAEADAFLIGGKDVEPISDTTYVDRIMAEFDAWHSAHA